jgi:cytidine deaminase
VPRHYRTSKAASGNVGNLAGQIALKPDRSSSKWSYNCGALVARVRAEGMCVAPAKDGDKAGKQPPKRSTIVPDIPQTALKDLVAHAKHASKRAYCPYSGFPVGAAVMTDTGDVFTGCNVENASYGLTICAERNAVFQMAARGKQRIKVVVVYTPTQKPASPCGACRQVINEFGPEARLVSVCDGADRIDTTLDKLLPSAFGPRNLR